ncbi:hypothetical protein EDC04DRAFT_2891231 [Pisolithus marmoratus]|nr:hypothetical protein EDC04DRAFT_2891231 [Pisolithus marmoratus]
MHNSSTDCAADNDAMVENIANWVVEHLTPMLTDLMRALTTAGGHLEPSAKAKGKQKETGDEDASGKQITVMPPPDSSAWERDWSSDDSAASQQSMPLPLPLPPSPPPPPPPPPQDLSILALQKMQALLQRDNISWSSPQQKEAMMKILG